MKPAGLAALVTFALILTFGLGSLIDRIDPLSRHARAVEIERSQRLAADLYWADFWAGALLRLVPATLLLIAGMGLAAVLVLLVYRRWASWAAIRADAVIRLAAVQTRALADRAGPDALPAREAVALLEASLSLTPKQRVPTTAPRLAAPKER